MNEAELAIRLLKGQSCINCKWALEQVSLGGFEEVNGVYNEIAAAPPKYYCTFYFTHEIINSNKICDNWKPGTEYD